MKQAVGWRLIDENPAALVKPPRVSPQEPRILTVDEVNALMSAAEGVAFAPLIALIVGSGLRRSEALGLSCKNIDLDLLTVNVEQGVH